VSDDRTTDDSLDYRPVSLLAVAALIAGGLSSLALVTRFAWALPLVGGTLAMTALTDIARAGGTKAGRLLALAGLALSLGFGAQAVTSLVVDRWILGRRAAAAASAWIDAMREGRTAEAMAMCSGGILPLRHDGPGEEPEEPADEKLARFAKLDACAAVLACGDRQPIITSAEPAGTDDGGWRVAVDLGPCGASEASLALAIVPRQVDGTAGPVERWLIMALAVRR